jgi:hypothetical protein
LHRHRELLLVRQSVDLIIAVPPSTARLFVHSTHQVALGELLKKRSSVDFNRTTNADAEQRIFMGSFSIYDEFRIVAEERWQIDERVQSAQKYGELVLHHVVLD